MKVYIYGFRGGMAKRYRAILRELAHEASGEDADGVADTFSLKEADAVIIATPTSTHAQLLRDFMHCGKPILCEKPITKDLTELEDLVSDLKAAGTRLRMVDQYRYLVPKRRNVEGFTNYNYFRHGTDGILWDCINISYHANGDVELGEQSPIWSCQINGRHLSLADMDGAYYKMIEDWLSDGSANYEHILDAHRKVQRQIDAVAERE